MTSDVVMRLDDSDSSEGMSALETLGELAPTALAQYVDDVVARLEDSNWAVRSAALRTLRTLGTVELTMLAQHAGAVVARLEDST